MGGADGCGWGVTMFQIDAPVSPSGRGLLLLYERYGERIKLEPQGADSRRYQGGNHGSSPKVCIMLIFFKL